MGKKYTGSAGATPHSTGVREAKRHHAKNPTSLGLLREMEEGCKRSLRGLGPRKLPVTYGKSKFNPPAVRRRRREDEP